MWTVKRLENNYKENKPTQRWERKDKQVRQHGRKKSTVEMWGERGGVGDLLGRGFELF